MTSYLQSNQVVAIVAAVGAAAYVVDPRDSGKTILVPTINGAYTVTLPTLAAGLRYRFLNVSAGAALGFGFTIAPVIPANIVRGALINFTAVLVPVMTPVVKNGTANCAFLAASVEGDYIDLNCDGVSWYVTGLSTVIGLA